jgi:hypothetical protein
MMATTPAATSLAVLELAQKGRFAQIREMFAPQLRPMLTTETIQAAWAAELAVVISVTEAGRLAGIQLAPASAAEPIAPWEPPGYADPDTFDEQDLMVGSGPLAVPGTLSLPARAGRGHPPAPGAPGRRRRSGLRARTQPGRHRRPASRGGRAVGGRAGHPGRRNPADAQGRPPAGPPPRRAGLHERRRIPAHHRGADQGGNDGRQPRIVPVDPDNHLFFPGTGPSAPAEYEPAQHMDPTVVADIADWLTTVQADVA